MFSKTATKWLRSFFYVNSSIVCLVLVQTWAFGRMRQSTSMGSRHYNVFVSINHDIPECPFPVTWKQNHVEFVCSASFGNVSATLVNRRFRASKKEA